jgi:hypothetical protein
VTQNTEDTPGPGGDSLIRDLCESRLFPSRHRLRVYTAREVSDLLFLYILALQILRSDFDMMHVAVAYVRGTVKHGNFTRFRFNATDLHVLIHQILSGDIADLKKNKSNAAFVESLTLDEVELYRWLARIARNQNNPAADRRFLLALQDDLRIADGSFRAMRRLIIHWGEDSTRTEQQLVMTRLLMAFRRRAPKSELLPYLEKLAKRDKLELKGSTIRNPETEKGDTPAKGDKPGILAKLAALGIGVAAGHAASKALRR